MTKKSVLKDIRYSKKLALAGLSAAAAFGATTVAHVVHAETYTVQAGDTLSEIAENHNTTVDNLAQTNNISNPDFIFAGQTIEIGGAVSNLGAAQAVQDDVNTVDQAVASAEEVQAQPQEDFDASATSEAVVTDYSQDTAATSEAPVQEAPVQEDTATQDLATSSEAPAQDQASTDQATADTTSEAPASEETDQTASSEEAQAPQDANAVVSEETASSEAPQEDAAPASEVPEAAPAPASTGYSSNLSAADAAAKEEIAQRESGGSYTAENGSYYGRYQLTRDYLNNDLSEENQEKTADDYVNGRYGSWSAALDYWNANGWY